MTRFAMRILRYPLYLIAELALVALIYLGATYVGAALPGHPAWHGGNGLGGAIPDEPNRIYLLTTLLHADFAIPVDDEVRARFAFLGEAGLPIDSPALRYLVFGWGSRAFYTATPSLVDIRPAPTLRAITGDDSVMHILPARDVSTLPDATAIHLPDGGFDRLLDFIQASFQGKGSFLQSGYGFGDVFYAARGGFNIFRPCNIWVADGLRQAGIPTGAWTPTTQSLMLGLSLHAPGALAQ